MKNASVLAAIAATLPFALAGTAYIPYAYNESEPSIHNQPVTANNGWFYINEPTTATCPDSEPDCPSQNTTIISGPTNATSGENFWMDVLEEGGQIIFTNGRAAGRLGYAAADSNSQLPYLSLTTGVSLGENDDGLTVLQYEGSDSWSACDNGNGTYIVEYGSLSACVSFEIVLEETTAEAVQYYDCVGCEDRCYVAGQDCTGNWD